jgi:hypothetical protein
VGGSSYNKNLAIIKVPKMINYHGQLLGIAYINKYEQDENGDHNHKLLQKT